MRVLEIPYCRLDSEPYCNIKRRPSSHPRATQRPLQHGEVYINYPRGLVRIIGRRQRERRDVRIIVSTDTSTSDIFLSLFPLPGELKFECAERDALLLFRARDLVGCWRAIRKLGDSERLDARERSVPNTRRVPALLPTKHHPACGFKVSSVTITLPFPSHVVSLLEFTSAAAREKIIIGHWYRHPSPPTSSSSPASQ